MDESTGTFVVGSQNHSREQTTCPAKEGGNALGCLLQSATSIQSRGLLSMSPNRRLSQSARVESALTTRAVEGYTMYISNVKNIHMTTSTKSNRIMQTISGFVLAVSLLGAGCNNAQLPTPTPTTTLSTPEDAWKTFTEGWKKGDLNTILSSCAPNSTAQTHCREQFIGIQENGHVQDLASVISGGSLTSKRKLEDRWYYTFSADGKGTTVTFGLYQDIGWKLEEF